jgi:hypothetical protein
MEELASSLPPTDLEQVAFSLYEKFRPQIPRGTKGWGQAGTLSLARIRSLAEARRAK